MASNRSFNVIEEGTFTATQESSVIKNLNNQAGHFVVGLTAITAGSLTLEVYGVTEQGYEYRIFRSLPMLQVGTYRTSMSPSQNCVAGIVCRDFLPLKIKFRMVHSTADAMTYGVDLELGEGV